MSRSRLLRRSTRMHVIEPKWDTFETMVEPFPSTLQHLSLESSFSAFCSVCWLYLPKHRRSISLYDTQPHGNPLDHFRTIFLMTRFHQWSDSTKEVVHSSEPRTIVSIENYFLCTLLLLHTNFQIFTTQMKIFGYSFPQHSSTNNNNDLCLCCLTHFKVWKKGWLVFNEIVTIWYLRPPLYEILLGVLINDRCLKPSTLPPLNVIRSLFCLWNKLLYF